MKDSPLCISSIHHVAIICSDYLLSKRFYSKILGFEIMGEVFREERNSWKLDLKVDDIYQIELFSFPSPPPRPSRPEACGLRHLAFRTSNIEQAIAHLTENDIACEEIRTDPYTGKKFTFFNDPDGLPIELYEQ